MMGVALLNEYQLIFADSHTETFMAKNARSAVNAKETDSLPLAQVTRVKTGIGVETPVGPVRFKAAVLPDTAESSGCRVAPATWVVPEGARVIFTAMPGTGFQFDGWYAKGSTDPLSTELIAELEIDYPTEPTDLYTELEAHFSPVV
jgi:hypothetical protein